MSQEERRAARAPAPRRQGAREVLDDALIELAGGQEPGVAGKVPCLRLDDQRRAEKTQDWRQDICYAQGLSPWSST